MSITKNKDALPFRVTHGRTLARVDALSLADLLDSASRVLPNDHGWELDIILPRSNTRLTIRLREQSPAFETALCGWASYARFGSRVISTYDEEAVTHYAIEMRYPRDYETWPPRFQVREGGFVPHSKEMLAIIFSTLLEYIAPDRGDDDALARFYGPDGLVDHENPNHVKSVRAAKTRNQEIAQFFSPEITSALL